MSITTTSTQPAGARRAVIFCCDSRYLPYTAHAAAQIAALHPHRDFDICLCHGECPLTLPESLAPLGLRQIRVDVGGMFGGLRLDPGATHDVYLRLALPEALRADYDRILYLDGDIFVQGGDFSRLLGADLGSHPIAAVRDNIQWRTPERRPVQFARLGLPGARYFNAGVVLMDTARCVDIDLLGRCVDLGRREAARMIRHDQNLFNAVLQGDWAELSPTWNWQYSWAARLFAEMRTPNVVHFIGGTKPWRDSVGDIPPRYLRTLSAFLSRHFPELPRPAVAAAPMRPCSPRMVKMVLKHLVSARAMCAYLDRFEDDFSVIG